MKSKDIDIPKHWVLTTIGDVCSQPQYGYTTKATDKGDLHLLRTTDITGGSIDWGTVPYCSKNPDYINKYLLEDGDIVISRAGSVGVSYLLEHPKRSVFASYLIRFKPFIDRKFFRYFLDSPFYWQQISENRLGIAVPNVNASKLKAIPFPLPPANEQNRIVAKIEALFSELDKGIESLKTAREQLKIYRQAVLKHAFEGKLTARWREENNSVPWQKVTLGSILSFLTSGSRGWAKYYAPEGDIFIRAQNLKHDRLELDDVAYVKLPGSSEGTRTRVQVGDMLVTITGANVTKTACVQSDLGVAYVSQHVALCRPVRSVDPDFLYWYLVAEAAGRRQLNEAAYGAGKPGLNLDNIRMVEVTLPGLGEQREVVEKIREMLSVEEHLGNAIDEEIRRSEILRQSILKKAFSGKLVTLDQTKYHLYL